MRVDADELADLLQVLAPRLPNGGDRYIVSLTKQQIEVLRGLVQEGELVARYGDWPEVEYEAADAR